MFTAQDTNNSAYQQLDKDTLYHILISYAKSGQLEALKVLCRHHQLEKDYIEGRDKIALYGALDGGHRQVAQFLCDYFGLKHDHDYRFKGEKIEIEYEIFRVGEVRPPSPPSIPDPTNSQQDWYLIYDSSFLFDQSAYYGAVNSYSEIVYAKMIQALCDHDRLDHDKKKAKVALRRALEAGHERIARAICDGFKLSYAHRGHHMPDGSKEIKLEIYNHHDPHRSPEISAKPYEDLISNAEGGYLIEDLCYDNKLNKPQAQGREKIALRRALEEGHYQVAHFLCRYFGLTYEHHLVHRAGHSPTRNKIVIHDLPNSFV